MVSGKKINMPRWCSFRTHYMPYREVRLLSYSRSNFKTSAVLKADLRSRLLYRLLSTFAKTKDINKRNFTKCKMGNKAF